MRALLPWPLVSARLPPVPSFAFRYRTRPVCVPLSSVSFAAAQIAAAKDTELSSRARDAPFTYVVDRAFEIDVALERMPDEQGIRVRARVGSPHRSGGALDAVDVDLHYGARSEE